MHEKRIARGAAVLDAYDPTWRERINRGRLNTADILWCPIGQALRVTGLTANIEAGSPYASEDPLVTTREPLGWHTALDRLGAPPGEDGWSSPARNAWTVEHGFESLNGMYSDLTDAWLVFLDDEVAV